MLAPMSPEFASLQLTLVDRFVQLGLGSPALGVHQLTNFQRRLGVGTPTDPPSNELWIDLLGTIDSVSTHDDRVDAVMANAASRMVRSFFMIGDGKGLYSFRDRVFGK